MGDLFLIFSFLFFHYTFAWHVVGMLRIEKQLTEKDSYVLLSSSSLSGSALRINTVKMDAEMRAIRLKGNWVNYVALALLTIVSVLQHIIVFGGVVYL